MKKLGLFLTAVVVSIIPNIAKADPLPYGNHFDSVENIIDGGDYNGWGYFHSNSASADWGKKPTTNLVIDEINWHGFVTSSTGSFSRLTAKGQSGGLNYLGTSSIQSNVSLTAAYTFASTETGHMAIESSYLSIQGTDNLVVDVFLESAGVFSKVNSFDLNGTSAIYDSYIGNVQAGDTVYVSFVNESANEISFDTDFTLATTDVPEPATMALLAAGGFALLRRRKNKA